MASSANGTRKEVVIYTIIMETIITAVVAVVSMVAFNDAIGNLDDDRIHKILRVLSHELALFASASTVAANVVLLRGLQINCLRKQAIWYNVSDVLIPTWFLWFTLSTFTFPLDQSALTLPLLIFFVFYRRWIMGEVEESMIVLENTYSQGIRLIRIRIPVRVRSEE